MTDNIDILIYKLYNLEKEKLNYRGEIMTVKLTIENANEDLIKDIKSNAKISKSKVKIQEEKGIDKAIKSYKKEKDNLKIYKNFKEFEKYL